MFHFKQISDLISFNTDKKKNDSDKALQVPETVGDVVLVGHRVELGAGPRQEVAAVVQGVGLHRVEGGAADGQATGTRCSNA